MLPIREVKKEDYARLSVFLSTFEDDPDDEVFWLDRLMHWWEENPYFNEALTRGWILEDQEQIVGFLGIIPTEMRLRGKSQKVYSLTTWRVLASYRSHSMFLLMRSFGATRDTLLFDTTGSRFVEILKRFQFRLLPVEGVGDTLCYHRFVLNLHNVARRLPGLRWLAWLLIPLTLLYRLAIATWLRIVRTDRDIEVKEVQQADEDFDRLWSHTAHLYANTNIRDTTFINWHCFSKASFRKNVVVAYCGDRMVGFLIFKVHRNPTSTLKSLQVLDLWYDPDKPTAIRALLKHVLDEAFRLEADTVSCFDYRPAVKDVLKRLAFLSTCRSKRADFVRCTNPEAWREIQPSESYFCRLQGDVWL